MSQNDFVIDNGTGLAVRQDIESAFQALASNNSGSSTPSTTYAYQFWADTSAAVLKIRNSANNDWIELLQLDGTLTLEDGSASAPALGFRDDLDTGIFSGGANEFNIATGGTERFVIDSSGNCGIGITSPNAKVTISETGTLTGGDINANGDGLVIDNNGGNTGLTFKTPNSASSRICFGDPEDNNVGQILYNHSTDDLTITAADNIILSGDNVGIGVTTVQDRLHIGHSGNTNVQIECTASGSGANAGVNVKSADGGDYIIQTGNAVSGGLRIYDAGASSERITLKSDGNVGIGTTAPDVKLTVSTSSGDAFMRCTGGTNQGLLLNKSDGTLIGAFASGGTIGGTVNDVGLRTESGNKILFSTATTIRLTIDASGNIGAPSGTNIFNASDLRLKKNVADLDKGLSAIKSLRPVSFNWKDGFCNEEKQTLYGFIAQEVKTIDSNLVQKFSDSPLTIEKQVIENPLTVNEKLIIPMLVKAIQELEVKVAALEAA